MSDTPQRFTAQEVREAAQRERDEQCLDDRTPVMLDAFAARLAHEEQVSDILGPRDENPCDTAERLRAQGRAEVYAEIAKLDWIDDSDRLYKTCFFCQADQPQWLGVQGERAVHEPDCLYLRAQSAVAPPAPDGVD